MTCPECGREGPADPTTGYNGDDICPECREEIARENAGPAPDEAGDPYEPADERWRDDDIEVPF